MITAQPCVRLSYIPALSSFGRAASPEGRYRRSNSRRPSVGRGHILSRVMEPPGAYKSTTGDCHDRCAHRSRNDTEKAPHLSLRAEERGAAISCRNYRLHTNQFACTVCRFADGTPSRRALRRWNAPSPHAGTTECVHTCLSVLSSASRTARRAGASCDSGTYPRRRARRPRRAGAGTSTAYNLLPMSLRNRCAHWLWQSRAGTAQFACGHTKSRFDMPLSDALGEQTVYIIRISDDA